MTSRLLPLALALMLGACGTLQDRVADEILWEDEGQASRALRCDAAALIVAELMVDRVREPGDAAVALARLDQIDQACERFERTVWKRVELSNVHQAFSAAVTPQVARILLRVAIAGGRQSVMGGIRVGRDIAGRIGAALTIAGDLQDLYAIHSPEAVGFAIAARMTLHRAWLTRLAAAR